MRTGLQTLSMKDCGTFLILKFIFRGCLDLHNALSDAVTLHPETIVHFLLDAIISHTQWPQLHMCPILELIQLCSGNALGTPLAFKNLPETSGIS